MKILNILPTSTDKLSDKVKLIFRTEFSHQQISVILALQQKHNFWPGQNFRHIQKISSILSDKVYSRRPLNLKIFYM